MCGNKGFEMNQRIRQLAEQATTYIDPSANDGVCWNFDKEKFAQLIVKETMQVVANNLPPNTYLDVADAVIEHFGVEP
jgi:hypothetical protein